MIAINVRRGEAGGPFAARQGRALARPVSFALLRTGSFAPFRASFDRALRTVKEYHETVESIHLNPVRRGWVKTAEE